MRTFLAVTLATASLLFGSTAFAQDAAPGSAPPPPAGGTASTSPPPPEAVGAPAHPIALGVVLGYSFNNIAGDGAPEAANAYGLGFGIRGGYTFPFKLYVGGTFIYHLGYSKDVPGGSTSFRVSPLGAEAGYDIDLGPIQLRPFLGLGLGIYSASTTFNIGGVTGGGDNGGAKLAFWPGVLAMYNVTEHIFVGLDLRYTILTGADAGGTANAFGFYANAGYRL